MTARTTTGCPARGITDDPRTDPSQTPAVSLPRPPRKFREAGRPVPHHGGAEEHSLDSPRSRRAPLDDQPVPTPGESLPITSTLWHCPTRSMWSSS